MLRNKKRIMNKKQGGFSLNEILVATAIMGTAAAVSAPYFGDMLDSSNTRIVATEASNVASVINAELMKDGNTDTAVQLLTSKCVAHDGITIAIAGNVCTLTLKAKTATVTVADGYAKKG